MADLILAKEIPMGWRNEGKEPVSSSMTAGDLSNLLQKVHANKLRFNLLKNAIEVDGRRPSESEIELLHVDLAQMGWLIRKDAAIDAVRHAALRNAYNPVEAYLDTIADSADICPADIDSLASTYLQTRDPLYDAMLAATLIGAVWRTYEPGCKFDSCLVLNGGQGIGKSSVFRALAGPDWFVDTPHHNELTLRMAMHSCWIMELAELDSLTSRKDAGSLKSLLSSPVDHLKLPYGRKIEELKRRSIMVATCNRDDFLRDETGSRRFWVIPLPQQFERGQVLDVARITADRDAIWKAAVLAYREGRQPFLSMDQQDDSNRRNRSLEIEHPWESAISEWIERTYSSMPELLIEFAMDEVFRGAELGISWSHVTPRETQQMAAILRRLGYLRDRHQTRRNGTKQRLWRMAVPEASE